MRVLNVLRCTTLRGKRTGDGYHPKELIEVTRSRVHEEYGAGRCCTKLMFKLVMIIYFLL